MSKKIPFLYQATAKKLKHHALRLGGLENLATGEVSTRPDIVRRILGLHCQVPRAQQARVLGELRSYDLLCWEHHQLITIK